MHVLWNPDTVYLNDLMIPLVSDIYFSVEHYWLKNTFKSRLTLGLIKIENLELYTAGVEVWLHSFLTLALDRDGWLTSCPGRSASLNRAQEPIWTFGEEKYVAAAGIRTQGRPVSR